MKLNKNDMMLKKEERENGIAETRLLSINDGWKNITKEYLENEYIHKFHTIKEIAIDLGISSWKLAKLLKSFNIKIRNKCEIANLQFKDFIGKRFGKLVVIRRVSNNKRGSQWECKCDCGNIKKYTAHHLNQGDAISCGCKRRTKYEEIPGSYFRTLKINAVSRNLEYNLSPEYLWNLYLKQNKKCIFSGVDIIFHKDCTPENKLHLLIELIRPKVISRVMSNGFIKLSIK